MASILVMGDYVLDYHIYEGKRPNFVDKTRGVREVKELGGAALVHYILKELGGNTISNLSVALKNAPPIGAVEDEERLDRQPLNDPDKTWASAVSAYAVWKSFNSGSAEKPKYVWRTNEAMGFGGQGSVDNKNPPAWTPTPGLPAPDVIVISEGGLGFRENEIVWPADKALDGAKAIVLKTAAPLCDGSLWKKLTEEYSDKLVVIVSSLALRETNARISSGYSWDATVESVFEAIKLEGPLEALRKCRHLIISFGTEGGLWIDFNPAIEKKQAHLIYDAQAIEGERRPKGDGTAFGFLSCLTAAISWQAALPENDRDFEAAIEGALSAQYNLLDEGHGLASKAGAGFPAERLAKEIRKSSCGFARTVLNTEVECSSPRNPNLDPTDEDCLSIMHAAIGQYQTHEPEPAYDLAKRVAIYGPIALSNLPHLTIGNLISADQQEIEALRVLRRLILDYKDRKVADKPLSLGIFGPPGAGKSFAVKELAKNLIGKEGWMEFNLSQFKDGTDDLIGAFHQIRDMVLRGQLPVAFFDEFDSRSYKWLQYLLAPMQDGAFQEGQITHPIGKCIFIFAGGTSSTFASFGPTGGDIDGLAAFKMFKGPDFKSRLDGSLNVLGPNPRIIVRPNEKVNSAQANTKWVETEDPCDIFYPIRRALMIRSEFKCSENDTLDIDLGLLNALLQVKSYKNGARSLSKVIEPLKTGRAGTIRRSLVAPRQQLELQVDADEFLELLDEVDPITVNKATWLPDKRKEVARAIHDTWQKLEESPTPFDALSEFYTESNLSAADRMFDNLAMIGYTLTHGVDTDASTVKLDIEHNMDLLAKSEHDRWCEWHFSQGWELGERIRFPMNENPKTINMKHDALIPYLSLSVENKIKDREIVRHYPEFAKTGKMKIVKIEDFI